MTPRKKPKVLKLTKEARAFFVAVGSEGGKKRARTHSAEELSEWGKKGGRPRKQPGAAPKKGGA